MIYLPKTWVPKHCKQWIKSNKGPFKTSSEYIFSVKKTQASNFELHLGFPGDWSRCISPNVAAYSTTLFTMLQLALGLCKFWSSLGTPFSLVSNRACSPTRCPILRHWEFHTSIILSLEHFGASSVVFQGHCGCTSSLWTRRG